MQEGREKGSHACDLAPRLTNPHSVLGGHLKSDEQTQDARCQTLTTLSECYSDPGSRRSAAVGADAPQHIQLQIASVSEGAEEGSQPGDWGWPRAGSSPSVPQVQWPTMSRPDPSLSLCPGRSMSLK